MATHDSVLRGPDERPGADWPVTVGDALRAAAETGRGATFVDRDGTEDTAAYRELLADALRFVALLRARGTAPGSPVVLQLADARAMVTAVCGCALGGYVATPTAVSRTADQDDPANRKLANAWELLGAPPVIADTVVYRVPEAQYVDFADTAAHQPADPEPVDPETPAIILLTSGSTGTPKCVPQTHRSLANRAWAAARYNGLEAHDIALNWMPLDHVGGIVMWCLQSVFLGCAYVNVDTERVVADPLHWLDALDRHRATTTWSANFGFAMTNKALAAAPARGWDLSRVRHILDGGEAVVAATAHEFLDHLAPHGLAEDVLCPSWGMSETGSGVVYSRLSRKDTGAGVLHVAMDSLEDVLRAVPPGTDDAVAFTVTGFPIAGVDLRIVDDAGKPVPPWRIGALHVRGATVFDGYLGNPTANAESFTEDGWFVTGDRAFCTGDRLVLAGRRQDAVVINGVNVPVHEVDAVVATVAGVRPGHAALCSVPEDSGDAHRVVVFFAADGAEPAGAPVAEAIRATVSRRFGFTPQDVVELPAARVHRTTTGKIQRNKIISEHLAERRAQADALGLFAPAWRVADPLPEGTLDGHRLLIFGEPAEFEALEQKTDTVLVRAGTGFAAEGPGRYVVDPDDPGDHRALYAALDRDGFTPTAVLHGWLLRRRFALEATPAPAALRHGGPTSLLVALQAQAARHHQAAHTLVLTAGACAAAPGDVTDPLAAVALGLVRTATAESTVPGLRLVDVDPASPLSRVLPAELGTADGGPVVSYRDGRRHLLGLARAATDQPAALVPGGCYVLTGGLGAIGRRIARHLQEHYGARLLLVGRRDPDQDTTTARRLRELAAGGPVRYVCADAADHAALRAGIDAAERAWDTTVDGALHLAARAVDENLDDHANHTLATEPVAEFTAAVRAKLLSAWVLGKILADRPGARLVLFSSLNGALGAVSFGSYAAACTGLDGLAEYWHASGAGPVHSLAWSLWADTGMARTDDAGILAAVRQRGYAVIDPDRGSAEFERALSTAAPHLLVGLDAENPAIARLLGENPTATQETGTTGGRPAATVWEQAVATVWAQELGCDEPGADDTFFALGGSSIVAIRSTAALGDLFEARIPVGLLYENPTVAGLARAVQQLVER